MLMKALLTKENESILDQIFLRAWYFCSFLFFLSKLLNNFVAPKLLDSFELIQGKKDFKRKKIFLIGKMFF